MAPSLVQVEGGFHGVAAVVEFSVVGGDFVVGSDKERLYGGHKGTYRPPTLLGEKDLKLICKSCLPVMFPLWKVGKVVCG
jgi:hypothetical protein